MQPPRRGLVGGFNLGDDTAKRAVAQRILAHREQFLVVAALRAEHALGAEPGLLKPRRVEIEARERPKRGHTWVGREARGDPRGKQGRCRIVAPARRRARNLVQACAIEAAARERVIEQRDAEGQHRAARGRDAGHHRAKCGKLFGARPGLKKRCGAHRDIDSNVLYMFH